MCSRICILCKILAVTLEQRQVISEICIFTDQEIDQFMHKICINMCTKCAYLSKMMRLALFEKSDIFRAYHYNNLVF